MGILKSQIQDLYAVAAGTDTYTVAYSPAVTVYETGRAYLVLFTNGNTGAATLNINGLGATPIVKQGTVALAVGDIAAGQAYECVYDGTNFQINSSRGITPVVLTLGSNFTTTSATITDITGMSVPVEANSVYIVEFNCRHGCDNTGGSNFGWNAPAGATYGGHLLGRVTIGNPPVGSGVLGSGASASSLAFNTANSQFGYIQQRLLVVTGANAGDFDLRTNSVVGGQTTTIHADSTYLIYMKIG